MPKLCFKNNATVKKYDLKDNANKPRLAVKYNGDVKYLSLAAGPKDGELNVKLNGQVYVVQSIKPVELCNPVKVMGQPFRRSQGEADGYNWTSDPENNNPLCTTYGVSGAAYRPDVWGGQGVFRMWAIDVSTGSAYVSHPYTQIADAPYYFLYGDNNLTLFPGGDRGGYTAIVDILKNGESTVANKDDDIPVLFDIGDSMTVIIGFWGYNTRSAFQPEHTWYPIVRFADSIPASAYSPTIPAGLTTYNDIWQAMQTVGLVTEVVTSSGISHYITNDDGGSYTIGDNLRNRSNDKVYTFSHKSNFFEYKTFERVQQLAVDTAGYLYVRTYDTFYLTNNSSGYHYKMFAYAIVKMKYTSSGYSRVAKYKTVSVSYTP